MNKKSKHTWRRCKPNKFVCTSYSELNGRCWAEAVVYCTKKSHATKYEFNPPSGCDARCARHKPKGSK